MFKENTLVRFLDDGSKFSGKIGRIERIKSGNSIDVRLKSGQLISTYTECVEKHDIIDLSKMDI